MPEANSVTFIDVEVRTWPQRTDLLVISRDSAETLARFLPEGEAPANNPLMPYKTRCAAAIQMLSADQDYLQATTVTKDAIVRLTVNDEARSIVQHILQEHALTLESVELNHVRSVSDKLWAMPLEELYEFLCDWHDVVELHMPAGSSAAKPTSWVHRAAPARASHYHQLSLGSEEHANVEELEEAYEFFQDCVDVILEEFTFGHLLRHVYFHRTEFPMCQPFELGALAQLQGLTG
jgi:hypothetical protein